MDTATVDREDVEGAADADAGLFAALYPSLRRFAAVTGSLEDDPDDLVQEAVTRVLRRQSLGDLENPGAYLRRAIVNLAANERRGRARHRAALERLGSPNDEGWAEYATDLVELQSVEPMSRAVLFLVEVEGRPYAEVARLL